MGSRPVVGDALSSPTSHYKRASSSRHQALPLPPSRVSAVDNDPSYQYHAGRARELSTFHFRCHQGHQKIKNQKATKHRPGSLRPKVRSVPAASRKVRDWCVLYIIIHYITLHHALISVTCIRNVHPHHAVLSYTYELQYAIALH